MKKSLLVLSMMIILVGCTHQADETFKVGVITSLTGFGAEWGQSIQQGIDLAVEEVNTQGGINGAPIEVIYEDMGPLDLKVIASSGNKLLNVDKVNVITTQWGEDSEVIAPLAMESNRIMINIAAGAPSIPKKGSLIFMVRPSDSQAIDTLNDYLISKGVTNPALITEQSAYFENAASIVTSDWEKKTGNNPFYQTVTVGETDFRTALTKIKEAGNDAIFMYVPANGVGTLLKQIDEAGIDATKVGWAGIDDPVILDVAKNSAEGMVFPDFTPSEESFREAFSKKYGKDPALVEDLAYDTIKVIAEAAKMGSTTEELTQGLNQIENFPGASGAISFDEVGQRVGRNVLVKMIQNGEGVPIE